MISYAKSLYNQGLTPIPIVPGEKRPAFNWQPWISNRPSEEDFDALWAQYPDNPVGIITGEYEVIDVDVKNDVTDLADRFNNALFEKNPDLYRRLVIESTPSGGVHYWYRIDPEYVDQNRPLTIRKPTKEELNRNPKLKHVTVIETRGYGGQCVIAPSPGYELLQNDFHRVPTITPDERWQIFNTAWELSDQFGEITEVTEKPGQAYNETVSIDEIVSLLESEGYTRLRNSNGNFIYFNRPFAKHKHHVDAQIMVDGRRFYSFSTSDTLFDAHTGVSFFHLYATIKHRGDHKAAAKDLASQGYGVSSHTPIQAPVKPNADYVFDFEFDKGKSTIENMSDPEFDVLVKNAKFDPNGEVEDYNFFYQHKLEDIGLGFQGCLIPIFGPQKSRKTTNLGAIIASAITSRKVLRWNFKTSGNVVWIDTEQGRYYHKTTIENILAHAGLKHIPSNFHPFRVKDMSFKDRVIFIDRVMKRLQPTVLVIDGVKDLGKSYNDLEEANYLGELIGHWQERGCTIFPVLHMTKGDKSPRGHLGNTLIDKCDSALSFLSEDQHSVEVQHYISRGRKFDTFAYSVDANNLLYEFGHEPISGLPKGNTDEDIPF